MFIALNFKENLIDFNSYFEFLNKNFKKIVFFPNLKQFKKCYNLSTKKHLGLQNFSLQNLDETQALFKKSEFCLVGHSDRRKEGETDEIIAQKIDYCIKNNVTPILCIGEVEKMSNEATLECIKSQLKVVQNSQLDKIIVAYEPVFAIGSGEACDINHIELVLDFIKQNYVFKMVLYGGSVNEQNCKDLLKKPVFDGFLIGKTALDVKKINKIIEIVCKN